MSDARSLLRQQRAARRITHPNAAYSDTGKLLCTLCREPVKAESLWDAHVQSENHRKRQQTAAVEGKQQQQPRGAVTSHKRKHDDDEMDHDGEDQDEDAMRRKRSRADVGAGEDKVAKDHAQTPPSLPRRHSQTPSQGVELQIPSRPATPRDSNNGSSSTSSSAATTIPSRQASTTLVPGPPITPAAADAPKPKADTNGEAQPQQQKDVDEDEWAAFEAEIAAADSTHHDDATISAPAMTAEQSAAAKQKGEEGEGDGDPRRRTSKPEADLEDEREDAARALEDELDEMRGLEAKVMRFKQQRDALRQRATSHGQDGVKMDDKERALKGDPDKENSSAVAVVEEGEESEDDEGDDDWDGFRFRTGLAR